MSNLVIFAAATAGLALATTPAFAFNSLPSSAMPSSRQLADPDAALDSMTSTLRNAVAASSLPDLGRPRVASGFNFDGSDSSEERSSSTYPAAAPLDFGAAPTLSAADLYDNEPPFMPIIVGDSPR